MATTVNNNNIERLRKITFIICVPFYACTYKEKGTKRAEKGYQNRDKFFAEIVSILQADGWTLTTMGETLDCGKSTCPELTKGNERIYCHPEELTGEVQDEKAFAEILKGAASFRIVKKEAGDIYVCTDNEDGKQLYRDTYRDCIDEVIRDVVYLKTNIYGGRKGDWIDLDSATRIIGERIFIATKSNNDEYNSVTVLREYVTEELCRLQDAGRIEATTNKHGQTVIKWADERTLAYNARCKELEAEGVKVGDKVRHNKHEEVATVTAIREAFVNSCDGYRYLYTLDFGQSVKGPFDMELNGGEFLREAFTLQEASEIKPKTTDSELESLTAKYAKQIEESALLGCGCMVGDGDETRKDSKCVKVRTAYKNDSRDPKDWTYCVSWYETTPIKGDADGQRQTLRECENGILLEQAAKHMAYFELMARKGWTLDEILYGKAA